MSDFVEYKPMDVEHNVKAAVENLRMAYWSNEPEKIAIAYTEAETIIVSAICHDNYTVCKPDAEQPKGDLISREALKAEFKRSANSVRNWKEGALNSGNDESVIRADAVLAYLTEVKGIIDNALTVEPEITEKQAITKIINSGWLVNHDKELRDKWESPKGEWIYNDKLNMFYCKDCGLLEPFTKEEIEEGCKLPNFCQQCGADMRKGGDNA